jgi:predicted ArsR family transcriptional regulator
VASHQNPNIATVAVLAEPVRRRLFAFVRGSDAPVTRDDSAHAVEISPKLAAFHLDKLVDAGLLRVSSTHEPRPNRVGRRPKRYEPTEVEVSVSVPPRSYDLLADILVDAVAGGGSPASTRTRAERIAHRLGADLGAEAREGLRSPRLGAERALSAAAEVLDRHGFEPSRVTPRHLVLRNCPFHRLAERSRELVCGLNHALCQGLVDGLQTTAIVAELDPQPGLCCVQLRAATTS